MASLGEPDQPPPLQRVGTGDQVTSLAIVASIVAALFARERHGLGQRVDTSLLAAGLWMNSIQIQAALLSLRLTIERKETAFGEVAKTWRTAHSGMEIRPQ